jgi:ankyrin repeat protein
MNNINIIDSIFDEDIINIEISLKQLSIDEINLVDEKLNLTPLICAIDTDNKTIVEMILKAGADVNFTKKGLSLPIIHAMEIAVEAEDYSDDVDEVSNDGVTPTKFAKDYHIPAQEFFKTLP